MAQNLVCAATKEEIVLPRRKQTKRVGNDCCVRKLFSAGRFQKKAVRVADGYLCSLQQSRVMKLYRSQTGPAPRIVIIVTVKDVSKYELENVSRCE